MNNTDNIKKLYRQNLVDMGVQCHNTEYNGIYSPSYSEKQIRRYMSDHYLTEEGVQAQDFELYDFYEGLINRAIKNIDRNKETEYNILELGAGFGSATIPLLRIFPNSVVVATELSLPMLARLKSNLKNMDYTDRCILLQLNAEEPDFEENSFDFIFGAAILHHLFNPELVFERAYKILKPGGCAIFFEPFYEGYSILVDFYRNILRESGFSANQFSFVEKFLIK
jgi:SAM-dependent methyltransferase